MAHDELSEFLLSSGHKSSLSPEKLELLGKEAANLFLDKGVALNQGIAKLAGAHDGINLEQVKRVCEFANTSVYLAYHDKNKIAGAESSYPQFELADPARVFQDLSDGAMPTKLTQTDVDYGKQPLKQKTSSAKTIQVFEDTFGLDKTAHVTEESAVQDVMGTKDDLTSLRASLLNSGEQLDMLKAAAEAEYYNAVKTHLLEGNNFADVVNAADNCGVAGDKVAEILTPMFTKLVDEEVITLDKVSSVLRDRESLEKLSHRILNDEHPFISTLRAIAAADAEIDKVAASLDDIDDSLIAVNRFIRENFFAN
jgi:hypothetical protein